MPTLSFGFIHRFYLSFSIRSCLLFILFFFSPCIALAQNSHSTLPRTQTIRIPSQKQYEQRVKKLVGTGVPKREVLAILDQLLHALISDLQERSLTRLSPLALKGIGVRSPLAPQVADWLELRFSTLIAQQSQIQFKFCAGCQSQKTSLNDGSWVIQHGYPPSPRLAQLGREIGVKQFIDFEVSWNGQANTVHLQARLFDVKSAQIDWQEDYRSNPITSKTQRRGGKGVKIGHGIYDDQKKLHLNRSDHLFMVALGYGTLPTQLGNQSAYHLAFGYGEAFGNLDRFRYQLVIEPFFNTRPGLWGGSLTGALHWRLSQLQMLPLDPKDPSIAHLINPDKTIDLKHLNKREMKKYLDPLNGWWIHGGLSMMYVETNQGVAFQLGTEYITSFGLEKLMLF